MTQLAEMEKRLVEKYGGVRLSRPTQTKFKTKTKGTEIDPAELLKMEDQNAD